MTSIRFASLMLEAQGEGPAVVMLHGLGATSNSWQTLVPALSGYRIIRPDLPAAGRSPTPHAPMSVASLADTVLHAVGQLGVQRAHFVGHSFGTLICQHIAVSRPECVASLALFGPIREPAEAARERLRERAQLARSEGMCGIADQLLQSGLSSATHTDNPTALAFVRESHMRQDKEGFARSCETLAAAKAVDLARIACPALVVTGTDDAIAPPGVAYEFGDKIDDCRVLILPRCGHWTPIEKPQECASALADFLRCYTL